MPSDIIELIPRKNFFREESLPQTSEDIINLWLYFLATNFSKDYIFRQNDILESNNIIVAPPFIVSFYELQKLISKLGKQDQGLNIEFNRVKFFINHDIIKHLICCQNISILSDKTNQVIESIVSNDPNLNEFYPNNFYPFLTEVELTQQFTDFRKKTMDKESLAFAIFTTFSKKYPELKKNFEIITSSPVETKISTKFSNLEIQQFQAVLLDFQRWQVLRGNKKLYSVKFNI